MGCFAKVLEATGLRGNTKVKFTVRCPKCGNVQSYQPIHDIPDRPMTKCRACNYPFRISHDHLVSLIDPEANTKRYNIAEKQPVDEEVEEKEDTKEEESNDSLPDDLSFQKFARWFSYPQFKGLHNWQHQCHVMTYPAKYSMRLVPREHGKSVLLADETQWAMRYDNMDVLLLGWTARRKDLAEYIYNFYLINEMVATDARTSPLHFKTTFGGRFDTYRTTSKDTLGMHSLGKLERYSSLSEEEEQEFKELYQELDNDTLEEYMASRDSQRGLWIIIDDPIDDSFREERHKEKKLERRFDSTIYNINPDKFTFNGTKKFEEDFFYYIEQKFGDKLVKYVRSTGVKSGNLLCPERYTHPKLDTYETDIEAGKRDLKEIRDAIGEYWWEAEYEQNPHPITGEVWDQITTAHSKKSLHSYDLVCISIDRAPTINENSDYTGIIEIIREQESQDKLVTKDLTGKYSFRDTLDLIQQLYEDARDNYPNARVIVVIEKQGGGDSLINYAEETAGFSFRNGLVPVHSTRDKKFKIKDFLEIPIKRGYIIFLSTLMNSELVKEIKTFPYCRKFDAVDALAMGSMEMDKVNPTRYDKGKLGEMKVRVKERTKQDKSYKHPWERKRSRRSIF